jgi:uncharacterized protein
MRVKALSFVWLAPLLSVASLARAGDDLRLVEAVKHQDKPAVRALLNQKVSPKAAQPDGATALHWAVQWDDLDTATLLLRAGADPNASNDYGVTPLGLACANGDNPAMVELLLKSGATVEAATSRTSETALMMAARTGSVAAIKLLVAAGAEVNAREVVLGQTALMWAATEGNTDVVQFLLEFGADVHAKSNAGYTPLLFAARTGDVQLSQLLLDKGANVNEAATDGETALLIATIRSHTTLGKFLLDKGADPNLGPGYTPLHWAAGDWTSNPDVIVDEALLSEDDEWSPLEGLHGRAKTDFLKLLLAHGADPNARAEGNPPERRGRILSGRARGGALAGATPFLIAARDGDVTVMRLLVAAGADPLLANKQKTTPLMMAAGVGVHGPTSVTERDALAAVKLCVELGIDVNAVDANGETALHGAAYRGITGAMTIVPFLVEHGAKLNVTNKYGWTPLAIAEGIWYGVSDTRSDQTAELLRKLGAEATAPDVERASGAAAIKAGLSRR